MTTHTICATPPPAQPTPRVRASRLRRFWDVAVRIAAGLDAATRVAHGSTPPPDHPARQQERDRAELSMRLAARYPRT